VPTPLTRLIGRDDTVAAVTRHLTSARLLTLTGTGGVGKTRVALQVATEVRATFTDGVVFVPLAAVHDPALVLPTLAHALGLAETSNELTNVAIDRFLGDRHLLIVLDNFEQVVAAAPDVAALVAACPHVHVLVTSREPLGVAGEQQYPIAPLALPDRAHARSPEALVAVASVALFAERAHAVAPDFQLTATSAPVVAAICGRLDGLPLAIELAAVRVKLLPLPELLARLDHRLALLTGGGRDLASRHRTLRETIAWSYDLLGADERQLFARLAIFAGGATLDAAATICAPIDTSGGDMEAFAVLDGIASLIDKSLVVPITNGDEAARIGMLETIHEYAHERLTASGELPTIARAHAGYFLSLAETGARELEGVNQAEWLVRLEREHDNCRAALAWALRAGAGATAFGLCAALGWFWNLGGFYREGRTWMERALTQTGTAPPGLHARVLDALGFLIQTQGEYTVARAYHEESLRIMRTLGDRPGIARCLHNLAVAAQYQGDFAVARSLHEECLILLRALGDRPGVAAALNNLGVMAQDQGEHAMARRLFEESASEARAAGDTLGVIAPLGNRGLLGVDQGEDDAARKDLVDCLALFREVNYAARHGIAECLEGLATIAGRERDYPRAARLAGAADALRHEIGVPLAPAARARYEIALRDIAAHSAPDMWHAGWTDGQAMPLAQAVAYACEVPPERASVQPPQPANVAGLSAREMDVLRLLAAGKSNREIADALFLSPGTINVHVTHILTKTDTANRTEAAAFAHRHGLA
jgi:non-specific serine/threonine protein kinase